MELPRGACSDGGHLDKQAGEIIPRYPQDNLSGGNDPRSAGRGRVNLTLWLAYRLFLDRLPKRFLILAAGGEHRRCDSNQGYCELNQDEHWNHLMQDTHFNLPLLTSTPINNASC